MYTMFGEDHRQKNINEVNKRVPKGVEADALSVGDFVTFSHNFSTGDRSYCHDVFEVKAINSAKTHAQVSQVAEDLCKYKQNCTMFLPEYEIYKWDCADDQ